MPNPIVGPIIYFHSCVTLATRDFSGTPRGEGKFYQYKYIEFSWNIQMQVVGIQSYRGIYFEDILNILERFYLYIHQQCKAVYFNLVTAS